MPALLRRHTDSSSTGPTQCHGSSQPRNSFQAPLRHDSQQQQQINPAAAAARPTPIPEEPPTESVERSVWEPDSDDENHQSRSSKRLISHRSRERLRKVRSKMQLRTIKSSASLNMQNKRKPEEAPTEGNDMPQELEGAGRDSRTGSTTPTPASEKENSRVSGETPQSGPGEAPPMSWPWHRQDIEAEVSNLSNNNKENHNNNKKEARQANYSDAVLQRPSLFGRVMKPLRGLNCYAGS